MSESTERPRDWLDDILDSGKRAEPEPAEPEITGGQHTPETAEDQDEDLADGTRPRLVEALLGRPARTTRAASPAEPDCAHEHTVPVHAQPYGELVAMLCLDCDEQLPVPEPADDTTEAEKEPVPAAPVPRTSPRRGPVPVSKRPQRRSPVAVGRSYVRPIVFTLSAGLFGYSVGLVDVFGRFLPAADHSATGAVGTFLALGGGYTAWRLLGWPGVAGIIPAGIVGRAIAAVTVAAVAPGLAPDVVQILNQYGAYVGLNAAAVALLAASTCLVGGLYWLVDRRFRAMPGPVRWLVRIPLASAALAVALYAPGPR